MEFPKTHASYRAFCVDAIAADVKEGICRVSDLAFSDGDNSNMPTVGYEVHRIFVHHSCRLLFWQLPDGNEIHVGPARFKVPEILFNPVRTCSNRHPFATAICALGRTEEL